MTTSQRRRFGQRRGDETALAAGVTLVLIAVSVGGAYLIGARSSTHAESPVASLAGSPDGSSDGSPGRTPGGMPAGSPGGLDAPAPAVLPRHLSEVTPSERYFNSFLGDGGATLGPGPTARNIGIRPDMDERRQGYVVFELSGGYRTLSTTAGVSDGSPAGTRLLLEILGDRRVLASRLVAKGATVPLTGIDVSGVSELRFVVSNLGPGAAGDGPEGVFADPVLR
jgi:hypothetical protein